MPDITKQISEISLPADVSKHFENLFKDNIYYSYFTANPKLPWTRLGYTYDWAPNCDEYGLSEFVLKKQSEISVVKTLQVEEFYTYLETI